MCTRVKADQRQVQLDTTRGQRDQAQRGLALEQTRNATLVKKLQRDLGSAQDENEDHLIQRRNEYYSSVRVSRLPRSSPSKCKRVTIIWTMYDDLPRVYNMIPRVLRIAATHSAAVD
jgi:hypothetical protein